MVVRMSATVKPILVAHHTDVTADDRTQSIIAIVKPLQAAERFPVIAPFSRGVGLRLIEPFFAFGPAIGEKFAETPELCINLQRNGDVFCLDRDLPFIQRVVCSAALGVSAIASR